MPRELQKEKLFNMQCLFVKQLAYTLTAYCYGSKSVTEPDASSKRYLWDVLTNRTQNNSDRSLQAAGIV